jgi:hypothetical protein
MGTFSIATNNVEKSEALAGAPSVHSTAVPGLKLWTDGEKRTKP